jgi:hypothetical protein
MLTPNLLSFVSVSLLVFSCNTNSDLSNLTAQANQRSAEANPIISSEPSENVSLEDYWDEASSILSESYQLISRAKQSKCTEAQVHAQKAIELCQSAKKSNDKLEAETIIGKANEALIHSEDALALCEEHQSPENQ